MCRWLSSLLVKFQKRSQNATEVVAKLKQFNYELSHRYSPTDKFKSSIWVRLLVSWSHNRSPAYSPLSLGMQPEAQCQAPTIMTRHFLAPWCLAHGTHYPNTIRNETHLISKNDQSMGFRTVQLQCPSTSYQMWRTVLDSTRPDLNSNASFMFWCSWRERYLQQVY